MASIQGKIAKKLMQLNLVGLSAEPVEAQRFRMEKLARYTRISKEIRCQPVDANGISAEWIESTDAADGVVLYLHGGAYALGSVGGHRDLIARLARAARARVLALNYRLAPEAPFPAALEDAVTAYRWLIAQGMDPARIAFAGDSAGGGLVLAVLVFLRDAGEPLPAAAVCLSPWTDLALSGASVRQNAALDVLLKPEILRLFSSYYAGDYPLDAPLISPLYADFNGLPPLLIQVGTDEILLDDSLRVADLARKAGVAVELEHWEGMFHVFQMLAFLPEAQQAVAQIGLFLARHFVGGPR